MAEPRATTIRFTEGLYKRLDMAAAETGVPVNSIVVFACIEWLDSHTSFSLPSGRGLALQLPRAATIGRIARAVQSGKPTGMYPFERFSEQAKKVLRFSQEEAERARHSYIGTEHVLLALVRESEGVAGRVLMNLGVELEKTRAAIESVLGRDRKVIVKEMLPTSRVKKVIEISFREAQRMANDHVGTEHLLLGVLMEGEGIAVKVLNELGADLARVQGEIDRLLQEGGEVAQTMPRMRPFTTSYKRRSTARPKAKPKAKGSTTRRPRPRTK